MGGFGVRLVALRTGSVHRQTAGSWRSMGSRSGSSRHLAVSRFHMQHILANSFPSDGRFVQGSNGLFDQLRRPIPAAIWTREKSADTKLARLLRRFVTAMHSFSIGLKLCFGFDHTCAGDAI